MSSQKIPQGQTTLPFRRSARNTRRHDYREVNEHGLYINPRRLEVTPSQPVLFDSTVPAEYIAAQVGGPVSLNRSPRTVRTTREEYGLPGLRLHANSRVSSAHISAQATGARLAIRVARSAGNVTPGIPSLGLSSPLVSNSETETASKTSTPKHPLPSLPGSSDDGENLNNTNTAEELMNLIQESKEAAESSLKREHEDTDDTYFGHMGNDPKRLRTEVSDANNTYANGTNDTTLSGPVVWSNKRGGICEALPYFNSYKGSLYTKDKVVLGFLIDSEVDKRDVFSAQVIITSLGGGRDAGEFEVNGRKVKAMIRKSDAADDHHSVSSTASALAGGAPVVLVAGEGHPLYPVVPPHPYAVLGYFRVTHFWKERQLNKLGETVAFWRMRFEKADLDSISWWDPKGTHSHDPSPVSSETCNSCSVVSPTIFKNGWTCLNHNCETYFGIIGPDDDNDALEYSDEFINHRAPKAFGRPVAPLSPSMKDLVASGSHGTDLQARRGFVCPNCGCANRHVYWSRLVCENDQCGSSWPSHMLPCPQELMDRENAEFSDYMVKRRASYDCTDRMACKINHEVVLTMDTVLGGYNARIYFLLSGLEGYICGSVVVLPAEAATNAAQYGPDHLFRELEGIDIGLQRNPAAVAGHRLEGLTRHFQQNFGARYKFGVTVQSKGFDEAPEAILRGLHRLIWAANAAVAATADGMAGPKMPVAEVSPPPATPQFNELLALGYMEKDQIGYHDDGEKELGPTVGTLSLGSPSIMKFRPKRRAESFRGLPRHGETESDRALFKSVLEVPLRHGDLVVMHGTAIHRLYEHAVEPHGTRRFSLTARHIDLDTLSPADRELAVVQGKIPEDSWAYVYDGY